MTTCHHSFRYLKKLVELEPGEWLAVTPRERRDVLWRRIPTIDIRRCTNDASSCEHRADSRLCMITHDASKELQLAIS